MSNLDNIVTVNIDIAAPAVDAANFDNMLIFGPAPQIPPPRPLPPVAIYSGLPEVTEAGYTVIGEAADPVGIAARIAFSQIPRPSQIYVAAMQAAPPSIKDVDIKIITAHNYWTDAIGASSEDPIPTDLPWLQVTYKRMALSSMTVEIEKDDILVYGNNLPTTKNKDAFLQVAIGDANDPQGDQMNLPSSGWAGIYNVVLTATQGIRTTTVTGIVTFDGNSIFDTGSIMQEITPEMMTPVETLEIANRTTGWYMACIAGIEETGYEDCAKWTEAHNKQFSYTFLSDEDPVPDIYFRSHGWFGREQDEQELEEVSASNKYVHVAATARGLSFSAGSETWAFKRVAGIIPSDIDTTLEIELMDGHSNLVLRRAGRIITMNGQVRGGEWIDVIRGRDWLENDMQLRILNLLLMNSKIPFTNPGIAKVETQMRTSLLLAQSSGIVAPDEPLGNLSDDELALIPEELIQGGIAKGFVIRVPNAASIPPSEKAQRVLRNCRFVARLAGAIHAVRVGGTLTYEFFI